MSWLGTLRTRSWHAAGVYRRRLRRRPYPGVAVLAYHGVRDDGMPPSALTGGILHVSAGRLAEHCRVLRQICTPISVEQFLAAGHGAPLPPRPVLVTFDDGYASWVTHALPVLERFGVPAAMFLCTDPIARGTRFWFDAVAARRGPDAVAALKAAPYDEWRRTVAADSMPATPDDPQGPLTVAGVRRLAASPLIELGGHSVGHPILARASLAQQREEIAGCAGTIAEWTGRHPRVFAYPNGRPGVDFTADTASIARASYAEAFAVGDRFADPAGQRFAQHRFLMLDSVSGAELAHRLAGAWTREPVLPEVACASA